MVTWNPLITFSLNVTWIWRFGDLFIIGVISLFLLLLLLSIGRIGRACGTSNDKKHHFYVIFALSLWWLWRFRNIVAFCSHPMRKSDIFDNIRSSSFSLLYHRDNMACNYLDWLKSPILLASYGVR